MAVLGLKDRYSSTPTLGSQVARAAAKKAILESEKTRRSLLSNYCLKQGDHPLANFYYIERQATGPLRQKPPLDPATALGIGISQVALLPRSCASQGCRLGPRWCSKHSYSATL